jgi:murein DD-endopeptidase MepM/ murein hydrolase activator NlpD
VTFQQHTTHAYNAALSLLQRHRLGIVATVVASLGGFGITAVAIAPLAPDASRLPQRLVAESVQPDNLPAQLEALAVHGLSLRRSDVTRGTDTAGALLARLGVTDPGAEAFLRADRTAGLLLRGRGGKMVQAEATEDGRLVELVGRFPSDRPELAKTHFTRMTLARIGGQWQARLDSVPYDSRPRLASGSIRSSLFAATDEAGLPDVVASQLAEIFASEIDFHRELRKGDTFSVVYETLTADGEPVPWNEGAGRVAAAEFISNGRAHHAVWFTPADGKGGYYGMDGQSRRRAFLASPMEFSRITSGFAQRFHPLLQSWRKHLGVDYGAPAGTPVRSVGDGVVEFAGWQNGYGNVVQLQHDKSRETLYAHLSRINVRKGQRVEQGQSIGLVGSTGWSTGPHLHFEFRINGQHQDPLLIAKAADTVALDAASRQKFAEMVGTVRAKLQLAESVSARHAKAD